MNSSAGIRLKAATSTAVDPLSVWPGEVAQVTARPIPVDQAIFTSIRSTTGGGYRLIAASLNITAAERQELTQRCPSHSSLTSEEAAADALSSWRLRSGRFAVVWSRHAGVEHTARGGFRVHSQIVVLSESDYLRFRFSPTRVQIAMVESLGGSPVLDPPADLPRLVLPDPALSEHTWLSAVGVGCSAEVVFTLVEHLLNRRDTIVTGLPSALLMADAVIAALPLVLRADASMSVGLKFSPGRLARLTFLDKATEQARQLTRGKNMEWVEVNNLGSAESATDGHHPTAPAPSHGRATAAPGSPARGLDKAFISPAVSRRIGYAARVAPAQEARTTPAARPEPRVSKDPWMTLMREWWTNGRRREVCKLAGRMTEDASPEARKRIVTILADAGKLINAESAREVAAQYEHFVPRTEFERELVSRIRVLTRPEAGDTLQPDATDKAVAVVTPDIIPSMHR